MFMRLFKKPFYRFVSLLILISFTFTTFGANTAYAAPGQPAKKSLTADIGELPDKLPKTKLELTSKRTKYSTRYLNPDGSFTEEIFSTPQFYQDPADKKWKKIDNNLKLNAGKLENTANGLKKILSLINTQATLLSLLNLN